MKQKYLLFMLFLLFVIKGNSQSNYTVSQIPIQPFSGTLTALTTNDDLYSNLISLPFPFDFYGTVYNQLVISTNGYINFNSSSAAGFSPWSFNQQIPNPSFPVNNSILGCYEDLNNSTGIGSLTYGSYGTAPYRKFVVYFNNQPHFSCNNSIISSFQMILCETTNVIDVQILDRQNCINWNAGNGVIGLVKDGNTAITPPGRNTGNWTAQNEAWRFYRSGYYPTYSFVRCDDNSDGIQTFDLSVAANDLFPTNPSAISFYETAADAQTLTNPINPSTFSNTSNPQSIYAVNSSLNYTVKQVALRVIDCSIDADNDNVPTATEDINNDTNLANDDSDLDGISNYLDNDDDGDLVLTNLEYVFARTNATIVNAILDSDLDGILNYLDNDDDGDGILTWKEDYNQDGNPGNDDTNNNGIPDFLELGVALGITPVTVNNNIKVFPNPTVNLLYIQNDYEDKNTTIEIYSINGAKVKSLKSTESLTSISVADLQSGVYFIKVTMSNQVGNYKFIKN